MDSDGGVEAEGFDIAADQRFDGPGAHRLGTESVASHATRRSGGGKQRPGLIILDAGHGQPFGQPLDAASRCNGVVRSLPPLPVTLRMRCSPLCL